MGTNIFICQSLECHNTNLKRQNILRDGLRSVTAFHWILHRKKQKKKKKICMKIIDQRKEKHEWSFKVTFQHHIQWQWRDLHQLVKGKCNHIKWEGRTEEGMQIQVNGPKTYFLNLNLASDNIFSRCSDWSLNFYFFILPLQSFFFFSYFIYYQEKRQ